MPARSINYLKLLFVLAQLGDKREAKCTLLILFTTLIANNCS